MNVNIETLVSWSAPKRVTARGEPKDLRTAPATEAFWQAWRSGKDALKAAGVSCSPVNRDDPRGAWQAMWWQPIDPNEAQKRNETAEASRAADADIAVPAPDGLAYMPFQRAGIKFCMDRFNKHSTMKGSPSVTEGAGVLIGDEMGL